MSNPASNSPRHLSAHWDTRGLTCIVLGLILAAAPAARAVVSIPVEYVKDLAIKQNDASGQFMLGSLYASGQGVKPAPVQPCVD